MEVMKEVIGKLQENIEKSNGSVEEMQCIFYETAKELMNECMLKIEDKENNKTLEIELKELEFYYYDEEKHPDCYTHNDEEYQKNMKNILYIHKSNGKFTTNPRRGGIDITFGNGKYYGGILIRGVKINGKYIAGPANVRQQIAKELGIIKNINEKFNHRDLQEKLNILYKHNQILFKKVSHDNSILVSVRVFDKNHSKNFSKFKNTLYRFLEETYLTSSPKNFLKNKNSLTNITLIKAISYLSAISFKNIKITHEIEKKINDIKTQKTKDFTDILNHINLLKQKLQENECIKNKGTK